MSEQAQQHSHFYEEENDTLPDDTIKTPAIRRLSAPSATLPVIPSPLSPAPDQQEKAPAPSPGATVEAPASIRYDNHDDDEKSDEADIQATMKMPALKKPLSEQSEKHGSFSEESADKEDMTPEQAQPTLQEPTEPLREEPLYNERAVIITTIAEILAATVHYALAELATIISYKSQLASAQQSAKEATALLQETATLIRPASSPVPLATLHQYTAQEANTTETAQTSPTSEISDSVVTLQERTPIILDTPRPAAAAEEDKERVEEEEQESAASSIAMLETPRPHATDSIDVIDLQEQERGASLAPSETWDQGVPLTPISDITTSKRMTRPSVVQRPQRLSFWRRVLAAIFSLLLISSVVLLWRDLTATHLLLTRLDPGNGTPRFQQDITNYQDKPSLSTSGNSSSAIAVGLHNDTNPDGTQRILIFRAQNDQWSMQTQFAVPLTHTTVQLGTGGQIFINSTQAIQARAANGSLLWTATSDQPTNGVHRFQTISDQQTLYTIKSLSQSQVVAYDLRSGQTKWVQTLDDSLNYTPPFLLTDHMLYIASDHNIYALNNSDGTLRWQQSYPSRTLLLAHRGQTPVLIAAGTQGLLALDPTTGQPLWTFKGLASDTLTAPEFYQASTDNGSANTAAPSLIYATGITWRIPEIQEQVWLYAIDTRSGTQVWARRVGDSFVSADAGRIFSPQLDTRHHLVLLQHQISANTQQITAFNTSNGSSQWSTTLANTTPANAALFETTSGTPLLFRTLSNSSDLLWIFSPLRVLLLVLMLGSVAVLAILCLPFLYALLAQSIAHMLHPQASEAGMPQQVHILNSHPQIHLWMIVPLLLICIGVGASGYVRLHQTQETIAQLSTQTGSKLWQYMPAQPVHPLLTNASGSVIVSTDSKDHLTRLQSFSADGKVKWQTFASEGTFAIPTTIKNALQARTLLVTLSGYGLRPYQFAPDDTAYQHSIEHTLALYLFDQATGNILWQQVAISPAAQQQGTVLGADLRDLYIASTPLTTAQKTDGQATQLIAINRATGVVDWHIFGPTIATPAATPDTGTLLLSQGLAIWQVNGIIYAIDTAMGQIAWRHPLQSDAAALLPAEEQQMLEMPGLSGSSATPNTPGTPALLLVNRLDGVHALDLASGNELWHLTGLGVGFPPVKAGFALAGHVLLVYGNGQLQAFDTQSHLNLWSQKQLSGIEQFRVSDDGTLVYMLLLNTRQGNTLAPSIIALDTQTGATRWTFTLLAQTPIQPDNSDTGDSFFYSRGLLFVVTCVNSETAACHHQYLYALTGTTGKVAWKLTAGAITHIHLSQDGTTLIARTSSSAWEDLIAYLRG